MEKWKIHFAMINVFLNKFAAIYMSGTVACDLAGAIKPENAENVEKA